MLFNVFRSSLALCRQIIYVFSLAAYGLVRLNQVSQKSKKTIFTNEI